MSSHTATADTATADTATGVAAESSAPASSPWGDDGATMTCPVCQAAFTASGRRRFCGDGCRRLAWKRRHQPPPAPIVVPPGRPRGPSTVYECSACGLRALGAQRCADCARFMSRAGLGGACPHCDEPVTVTDLDLTEPVTRQPDRPDDDHDRRVRRRHGHNPITTTHDHRPTDGEPTDGEPTDGELTELLRTARALADYSLTATPTVGDPDRLAAARLLTHITRRITELLDPDRSRP